MVNESLLNKGVTKECASYCMRSIVQLLNGNTKKFEEYAGKALEINKEVEVKQNWTSCSYKQNGKKVKAKLNMLTGEIVDLDGNILKAVTR